MPTFSTTKHQNMLMKYIHGDDNGSRKMYRFEPETLNSNDSDKTSHPGFFLTLAKGNNTVPMEGCASIFGHYDDAKCVSVKETKTSSVAKYLCENDTLEVTVKMEFIKGTNVIRQTNSVKNIGKEKHTLTHFSSAVMTGIAMGGLKKWYEDDSKVKVHYCYSHWQGEAQWREDSLEHLGIYRKTKHSWDSMSHRFRSIGSWSTGRYYPLVMVEDTEAGCIWYMEIEGGLSWTIEVGARNSSHGSLFLEANSAEEETGFVKVLKPGETFSAASVLLGCVNGSFEEAAAELTSAKRKTTVAKWDSTDNSAPAFFNTYMDCIWGAGGEKSLPPLIEKAANAGIEVFCLDAGWHKWPGLGDYTPNDDQYGKSGLQGIFDLIKSKGMLPGVWLEIESLEKETPLYDMGGRMVRNGAEVSNSHFTDFSKKENCDFIESRIDMLYDMGVRFIKNDYNLSTMYGCEINGSSPAEGLKKHTEGFYAMIDRIMKKHPDLKIENCGSGGMRMDTGTLRHFQLQSTSDQEMYELNPAIVSGCAAVMPPEKAGVWSYPYPVSFYNKSNPAALFESEEYMGSMADGEQTVFNMINALCGTLYLSGRIDKADALNTTLINEGVEMYKKHRHHLVTASPIWPCGKLSVADKTHSALGFVSPDKKKITLAVWKFTEDTNVVTIDLSKYINGKKVKCEVAYPKAIDTEFVYNAASKKLSVKLPKSNTARFFEFKID